MPARPPLAELVDRREWAASALGTLAAAFASLEARLAGELSLPWPLGAAARRAIGLGAGAEAGIVAGYAAQRVLGQYDFSLFGEERAARLLFVAPNIDLARSDLRADRELFLRWIALHETTHVLQFESVPWLAPHLRRLAGELLEAAGSGIDPARLGSLVGRLAREPRALVRSLLRGELTRLLADPPALAVLDRLQATMSVIEGHAEHVMDVGAGRDPRLAALRRRLEERRARRGGLGELVSRLLGFELKLRQYELGKRFWDAIAERLGERAPALVWSGPAMLPDLAELERPELWLERVAAPEPIREAPL